MYTTCVPLKTNRSVKLDHPARFEMYFNQTILDMNKVHEIDNTSIIKLPKTFWTFGSPDFVTKISRHKSMPSRNVPS